MFAVPALCKVSANAGLGVRFGLVDFAKIVPIADSFYEIIPLAERDGVIVVFHVLFYILQCFVEYHL